MKSLILTAIIMASFLTGKAQSVNPGLVNSIHKILKDCEYYEVTEDMFTAIAEDERFQHEREMEYLKKIKFLIFVECPAERKDFYNEFNAMVDLKGFRVMMRSKSAHEQFTFYRKTEGNLYEYLLLHDHGLSYIVTGLKISTLNELSQIMEMAGSIGGG